MEVKRWQVENEVESTEHRAAAAAEQPSSREAEQPSSREAEVLGTEAQDRSAERSRVPE